MRYFILDGFRGFFLLFMTVVHLDEIADVTLGKLNHHYFGWVEDAQGFVFISGFVVGLVYGNVYLKKTFQDMKGVIYKRVITIYSYQFLLIMTILLLSLLLSSVNYNPPVLEPYVEEPVIFSLMSVLLLSTSLHMGILPMYIYFMIITPFVLMAIYKGYVVPLVVLSVLLWYFAQTGLSEPFIAWIETSEFAAAHNIKIGIFFDVFGWQVLFFSGLYFGFLLAQKKLSLDFLQAKQFRIAFFIGVAGFIFFGILDRIVFDYWISSSFTQTFLSHVDRKNFSTIYFLTFFLDLFLVTWLLSAGRTCGIYVIEQGANLVYWIFTRKFLVTLGQHSLQVFSFQVLLVYAAHIWLNDAAIGEFTGSLLIILGVLSLYIPVYIHKLHQNRMRSLSKRTVT